MGIYTEMYGRTLLVLYDIVWWYYYISIFCKKLQVIEIVTKDSDQYKVQLKSSTSVISVSEFYEDKNVNLLLKFEIKSTALNQGSRLTYYRFTNSHLMSQEEKDAFQQRLRNVCELLTPPGGITIDNIGLMNARFEAVEKT